MSTTVQKRGYLGHQKIIYFEDQDRKGEWSYIDGEWIWISSET